MWHKTVARWRPVAALLAALTLSGCTMKDQEAPPVAGPSTMAISLSVTATPDIIAQDGSSQSTIAVVARDTANQPIANLQLRMDVTVGGQLANDFGRLASQNITTGADGRAATVYTAPALPAGLSSEAVVTIYATPIGSNFDNATATSVSLRLVAPAIIYVPGSPLATFIAAPSTVKVLQRVSFDASGSSDPDGVIVSYQWVYGDGDIEYGVTQTHDFPTAGTYNVILTVTDNAGNKASTSRPVTVTP